MKKLSCKYGPWFIEYTPEDGARLDRLCYRGFDLLTTEPKHFKPPSTDYGQYENRPVYGYDDCFPSVEVCKYPCSEWIVPDHGEICWLKWDVETRKDHLIFAVKSRELLLQFRRIMGFSESELVWTFEVHNEGDKTLPFQHVIHPLMKLDDIADIQLPSFTSINDDERNPVKLGDPESVKDFLLTRREGDTHMLFIQGVQEGSIILTFENGLQLVMEYPLDLFPVIGIWWNQAGYPDEDGCRRSECAFEPIPGSSSRLSDAYDEKRALSVGPAETFSWDIRWKLD